MPTPWPEPEPEKLNVVGMAVGDGVGVGVGAGAAVTARDRVGVGEGLAAATGVAARTRVADVTCTAFAGAGAGELVALDPDGAVPVRSTLLAAGVLSAGEALIVPRGPARTGRTTTATADAAAAIDATTVCPRCTSHTSGGLNRRWRALERRRPSTSPIGGQRGELDDRVGETCEHHANGPSTPAIGQENAGGDLP
jgi:hypothetical protein